MALASSSVITRKPVRYSHPSSPISTPFQHRHRYPLLLPGAATTRRLIVVANSAEPSKSTVPATATPTPIWTRWALDSWKTKKALQLPEYPDQNELDQVLQTLESFPPIVFAGEARGLEDKLAQAAMGNAFLLQGGDCAESFKEFNANNIRDTFRVILQMGVVLMFGGQMPVIKVHFFFPILSSNIFLSFLYVFLFGAILCMVELGISLELLET